MRSLEEQERSTYISGEGGEGTIEVNREGEKKDNAGGKDREKGEKKRREKKRGCKECASNPCLVE